MGGEEYVAEGGEGGFQVSSCASVAEIKRQAFWKSGWRIALSPSEGEGKKAKI